MRKILTLMFLVCFVLAGCGLTKKDLGLAKDTPDETKVESRKALDLPPDFDLLPN